VSIPQDVRENVGQIVILMDGTGSMNDNEFADDKEIATNILSAMGPGDHLALFSVGPRFDRDNRIPVDQMPSLPPHLREDVLETVRDAHAGLKGARLTKKAKPLIPQLEGPRNSAKSTLEQWERQVSSLERPGEGGSNFAIALESIGDLFKQIGDPDLDKWLFVISDLQPQDASGKSLLLRPLSNADDFKAVNVVLIFPPRVVGDLDRILQRWKSYLGSDHITVAGFPAALSDLAFNRALLARSPISGWEPAHIDDSWVSNAHLCWSGAGRGEPAPGQ